jgi:tetratricopeptide (TPR) repeat protein
MPDMLDGTSRQCVARRVAVLHVAADAVIAIVLAAQLVAGDSFRMKAEATGSSQSFRLKAEATGPSQSFRRKAEAAGSSHLFRLKAEATGSFHSFRLKAEATGSSDSFRLQAEDPDVLYKNRENLASAQRAEQIWAQRLARNPKDFESAWKLARARYWLGGHAPEKDRKEILEAGIAAGRAASAIAPDRPEGHFWIAANMGALAESYGLRQGLKYRGAIKDELETTLRLDPAFLQGSADRALGRWYNEVPRLFGGSNTQSEAHLRKALTYNPQSTITLYFLAETLLDEGKEGEAEATLQKVLAAPLDPEWAPEDREFKDKARKLLGELRRKSAGGVGAQTTQYL